MNIDPKKVKELILIYSELNEEYQKELMKQAYILQMKQSQLNQIQKEDKRFKTDRALQEEIDKRTNECAKDAKEMLDVLKKMDDTDKAALFMMIKQLSGSGNLVQESDISITINQKDIPMKEYLEKYLIGADYEKAKEKATGFMNEYSRKTTGENE